MKKFLYIFLIFLGNLINAQSELVFVYFKDKPNSAAFFANPTSELTQKSIDRRTNLGIVLTEQDAPIEATYIQNIKDLGYKVTDYSKWLNGVAVNADSVQIADLKTKSYIQKVESFVVHSTILKHSTLKQNKFKDLYKNNLQNFNYGLGAGQIDQVNLRAVHVAGFTGKNITIAMIDTGFPTVDTGSVYARIRDNNQIKGGYNFVNKSADIYNTSVNPHGSYCLGVIAAYVDGEFVGSAPDADFYLYASEDASVEIPEEQLYWIEAAEEADRKGVDIISTSLGYYEFDDPRYSLQYSDMNGKTSFIARGAEIATQKGIVVVAANGNEGTISWHYLVTPADNKAVFSIGAVNPAGDSASFSSYGPNSEGDIKPDGSTRGSSTYLGFNNTITSGGGTSFATPLAAGGIACLLQANMIENRETLKNLLRQKASLYPAHDDQKGFGILNFGDVLPKVLANNNVSLKSILKIYPNPVKDILTFQIAEKAVKAEIYDSLGRKIKNLKEDSQNNVSELKTGIYYLKVKTTTSEYIEKFIKK